MNCDAKSLPFTAKESEEDPLRIVVHPAELTALCSAEPTESRWRKDVSKYQKYVMLQY
jgi:hypothetical protein